MSVHIPEINKITEQIPQNERTTFLLIAIMVASILMVIYFGKIDQKEQREAFLMQIEKAAEVTDRREQRTLQSMDKLSNSIDRNTQIMAELKTKLEK